MTAVTIHMCNSRIWDALKELACLVESWVLLQGENFRWRKQLFSGKIRRQHKCRLFSQRRHTVKCPLFLTARLSNITRVDQIVAENNAYGTCSGAINVNHCHQLVGHLTSQSHSLALIDQSASPKHAQKTRQCCFLPIPSLSFMTNFHTFQHFQTHS